MKTDKLVGKTVIVIDDDQDTQDLVRAYFTQKQCQIICFNDAETALEESQKSAGTWDVVLVDLYLPKMSGIEFTDQFRKNHENIPVILITTSKSSDAAVEAINRGAYDFIVKPIHFPQLQVSVERAVHIKGLNQNLKELREQIKAPLIHAKGMIGKSPKFVETIEVARKIAKSKANIFITGESGTGKELFAKFIHDQSSCAKGPFVAINCSAIPENLLESELFGHSKGAFTGAQEKKIGLFEEAQDGSIFLDEIGDLSLPLQAKLLRVLQEKKIKRVGENQYRPINCRVISATHKQLIEEINEGRFREDLYFRLNVIPLSIPPLRERQEDLLPLAESFLKRFAVENGSPATRFSKEAIKFIFEHEWRGNVRELENIIERAVVLASSTEISLDELSSFAIPRKPVSHTVTQADENSLSFKVPIQNQLPTLEEVINKYVEFAVGVNSGARDRTAKEIGIDRKTLYKRLKVEQEITS